jgi:hypothetical protein
MKNRYTPPYTITSKMVWLTNEITEMITKVSAIKKEKSAPILRKKNRIRLLNWRCQRVFKRVSKK